MESITKASKAKADALAPKGKEGMLRITTRADALDKADHRNLTNQAVIEPRKTRPTAWVLCELDTLDPSVLIVIKACRSKLKLVCYISTRPLLVKVDDRPAGDRC